MTIEEKQKELIANVKKKFEDLIYSFEHPRGMEINYKSSQEITANLNAAINRVTEFSAFLSKYQLTSTCSGFADKAPQTTDV